MKTVIIVRHAKSSWADYNLADVERPLNRRGKFDAPLMANIMKEHGYEPEKIYLSHSKRTRSTVKPIAQTLEIDKKNITVTTSLYHGYEDDYIDIISEEDNDINCIMLIGHNPGITYIANSCQGASIDNVPTCGVIKVESVIDNWKDFSFPSSKLTSFIYPKMYK